MSIHKDDDKTVKVIAGKFDDAEGPVKGHNVEPVYFDVEIEKDKEFNFDLPPTHNSLIYLIEGEIKVGENNHDQAKNSTLIILTRGEKLKVTSLTKAKFLLISGKPIAFCSICTSSGPGLSKVISLISRTSNPPVLLISTAFIIYFTNVPL